MLAESHRSRLPSQHGRLVYSLRVVALEHGRSEPLADSRTSHTDIIGLVLPDTSWALKDAGRFGHRNFLID
jgi:hypothetical protein